MKVLVIQFRKNKKLIDHEKKCFYKFIKNKNNVSFVNIFNESKIFVKPCLIFNKYTHIILGGSSEFSLSDKTIFPQERSLIIKKTKKLMNKIFENDFPTLGICFGHQLIGHHLGTNIIRKENKREVGVYMVYIAQKDILLKNVLNKFCALFAHIDFVDNKKIKHLIKIAKTNKDDNTILKIKNNIYGVQFHPELSKKEFLERIKLSNEKAYIENLKLNNHKNFKESEKIIRNFLSIKL